MCFVHCEQIKWFESYGAAFVDGGKIYIMKYLPGQ